MIKLLKLNRLTPFCLLFSLFTAPSFAAYQVTLSTGEWPPFSSQALAGFGETAKVVTRAFAAEGITVDYKWLPWKRAFAVAQQGKNVMGTFPWMKNAEREKHFYFSEPIGTSTTVLVFLKSKPLSWKNYDDLKGKTIGGSIGYHYSDQFAQAIKDKKFIYKTARSDVINLRKLLKGRLDAFACDIDVCKTLIAQNFSKQEAAQFSYSKKSVASLHMYLLISKKVKDGKKIIQAFNQGLKGIKVDTL